MAERMGFGQVDANNRVIPRWETQQPTQPLPTQAPARSPYDAVLQILQDPRNAWIGMSPLGMATRPMGWGAEVLRRYKLMGGTHETLDRTLMRRGVDPMGRDIIREGYRKATDLAAPPSDKLWTGRGPQPTARTKQHWAMEDAGDAYEAYGKGLREPTYYGQNEYGWPVSRLEDKNHWISAAEDDGIVIESGTKGNAAYDAVSRSVARMLDTMKDERGSFSPFGWGKKPAPQPDSGGFFPSLKQMQTAAPNDIAQGGRDMRQAYIDHIIGMNHYVDTFQPNNPLHVQGLMRLELNRPQLAEDIAKTSLGKMALDKEKGKAFDPSMETNPPLQVRRLFGLE